MRLTCITLATLTACAYHPDSYRAPITGAFPGTRVALGGCLDLAVAATTAQATSQVVSYTFGNRCDHRVTVDLASVRVVAHDADGSARPLVAYDPHREIRPLEIHARWFGAEDIEYDGARPVQQVCVDVGGIDGSVPRTERWVCP